MDKFAYQLRILPALLLCSALAFPLTNRAAVAPAELLCEFANNPNGIDVAHPRLSWQVRGPERAAGQTACQIVVASSPTKLAANEPDLWDTGVVPTSQSLHHSYAGKPLVPSQKVYWRVRLWDDRGEVSPWSETASWTMGLLKPEAEVDRDGPPPGWQARWICAPAATESLLLRREFAVRPNLQRALIHISGLGQYELQINGQPGSDQLLAPGWTDYNDTVLYDTLDVTALLRTGRNAIGITLGNGMYHVERRNRFAKFTGSFGPLRAIAQLELEYADGQRETVVTDERWRVHPGGITYASIFGGEDFDARLEPRDWANPGFDDSAWLAAVRVVRPEGDLRGHGVASDPLRVIEIRKPVRAATPPGTDVTVYDFGQNTSYMPRLRVTGPRGSVIRLTPAEVVNPDGSIQRSTMGSTNRGVSWWQYTKATNGEETWFPKFYYVGCRYLEARCSPPPGSKKTLTIKSLEGAVVHADATPVGDFECSNPRLNRIRDLVRWAQRANMVSVLTDCPHREKLGWLEQYHLNGPAIRYEFDLARMFTKGMNDMADAQTDSGLVPNIAPEYTEFKGAFRASPEWGSAFIIVPWQQFLFCADTNLLRAHYPAMKRYFSYLENSASNHILHLSLGDWFDLGPKKSGASQNTPPPVTATAFYFHDATLLARIAAVLAEDADAQQFATKAEIIRAEFNGQFFDAARGTYATGSQAANALALVMGIVEPAASNAVVASLVQDLETRNGQMTAGDIGFRFLLQALAQSDRSDLVYRMINQDQKPGYGYMLKQGATSLTEAWDANLTTSHNHFMLGHITEWFYKDLAGIDCDPQQPGFKRIIIRPQPVGDLTWARASYHSLRGKITSHWARSQDAFTLKVTIPANTTATVYLPARFDATATESGKPVDESSGVRFLRHEAARALYEVGAGDYEFAVRN